MQPLFQAYPTLHSRITHLTGGASWCITGASALLCDSDGVLSFELTKPKHWTWNDEGHVTIGIGGIGGSLEPGESALECVHREAREELGVEIEVASAETTYLIYEERVAGSLSPIPQDVPCPAFFTISENLYRRESLPECQVLAIATFTARLLDTPTLGDIYGLLTVPRGTLRALLGPREIRLEDALRLPGVRIATQAPVADLTKGADIRLSPVWTGRSLQILLQGGYLEI